MNLTQFLAAMAVKVDNPNLPPRPTNQTVNGEELRALGEALAAGFVFTAGQLGPGSGSPAGSLLDQLQFLFGAIGTGGGGGGALPTSPLNIVLLTNSLGTTAFSPQLASQLATRVQNRLTAAGKQNTFTLTILGYSGETTPQLSARAPAEMDVLYQGNQFNVFGIVEGINDLFFGATGVAAADNLVIFGQARKGANFDVRTFLTTLTPRTNTGTPAGYELQRTIANSRLFARQAAGNAADALALVALDPLLDEANDTDDGLAFAPDQVHFTPTGTGVLADYIADAVMEAAFGTAQPVKNPALRLPAVPTGEVSNTAGVLATVNPTGSYNRKDVFRQYLPFGQQGRIGHLLVDETAQSAVMGYLTANTPTGFASMHAAVWRFADLLYRIDAGAGGFAQIAGATAPDGSMLDLVVGPSGVITAQQSLDFGVSWSVLYTYAATATVDLFVGVDLDGPAKLFYPQHTGLIG